MRNNLTRWLALLTILTIVVTPVSAQPLASHASATLGQIVDHATSSTPASTFVPKSSLTHTLRGPVVSAPIAPASFDGDLRDIPVAQQGNPGNIPQEIPNPFAPNTKALQQLDQLGPDANAQRAPGEGDMPSPLITFDGLNQQDNFALFGTRVNPPDTNGAVGPNHYVQTVNLTWGIWDKSGNRLFGPAKLSALFAAAGTGTSCDTTDNGDPLVLYDSSADRWIVSQFSFISSVEPPLYECIAVSKGPNPVTDGWWAYVIESEFAQFPDYPKLSVWPDAYYYTARMFPTNANPVFSLAVSALDRSAMLAGRPARHVRFDLPGIYDAPLASNWRGAAPPDGTPNVIALSDDTSDSIKLWQFHVDWDNPANSTLSPEQSISVNAFEAACVGTRDCVPFTGSTPTTMLDALSPRLMFNMEYRRLGSTESIWASHTITESGNTALRWYEFRLQRAGDVITPTLYQQGTYNPADGVWRWMPSLAVDKDGNMAIGYSASSPSIDPQIRYTGRLITDTLGTLGQGEITMTVGTGHPTTTNSRWGDYSAMTLDPVDGCTFWYTQEYYTTTTGIPGDTRPWTTRIGAFSYPECTPLPAPGAITGTVYDATTLAAIPYIPVEATDGTYIYAGATDPAGVYTLTVVPGTYTVTGGPLASIGYPTSGSATNVVVTSGNTAQADIPLNGAPYLIEGGQSYDDSTLGNGNTYPEPGEFEILLTETISNTGVTTATNVAATLTSLTIGFNVITGTSSYPDIAAGSDATNTTAFGISIDGGVTCGNTGQFQKVLVSTQGTYTVTFDLTVGIPPTYTCSYLVPNLDIANSAITDSGGNSNGNGYIEPGEDSIDLDITLNNTGLANIGGATNVAGTIVALTPGVTVVTDTSTYPDIAANGTGVNNVPFNFSVSSGLACGAALDFELTATADQGTFVRNFQLVTGQAVPGSVTVFTDDVESGVGTWITSTNAGTAGFVISAESAHSPVNAWNDSPGALYPNGFDTSITSPSYDFTAFDVVTVTFWTSYTTEAGFDYSSVEYSTDGGATWNVEVAYDGASGGWVYTEVALPGAAHQSDVQIRFHLTSDGGVVDDGWMIDDIAIEGERRVCNPAVLATASSVVSSQEPNTVTQQTFNIQNIGYSELFWTIEETAGIAANRPTTLRQDVRATSLSAGAVKRLIKPVASTDVSAPEANVVQDGSFENGSPNSYWSEFSSNFGTPLCNPGCGGAFARTGDWWVWFGGAGSGVAESGYVTQTVTIPNGSATLYFYLYLAASVNGTGYFTVTVDSTEVFTANQTMTPTYGTDYTLVALDVSAFADGGSHILGFYEDDPAGPPTLSNFSAYVDDVVINATPGCTVADAPWLNVSPTSGSTAIQSTSVITATFDSTGLTPGNYTSNLCIASNDPYNPILTVPVTLTVVPSTFYLYLPLIRR